LDEGNDLLRFFLQRAAEARITPMGDGLMDIFGVDQTATLEEDPLLFPEAGKFEERRQGIILLQRPQHQLHAGISLLKERTDQKRGHGRIDMMVSDRGKSGPGEDHDGFRITMAQATHLMETGFDPESADFVPEGLENF